MIELLIKKEVIPLKNIWYNYKPNAIPNNDYELILDYKDDSVKNFIANFLGENSDDNQLAADILRKDRALGALGLIWQLNHFFDTSPENNTKPYFVLCNIRTICLSDNGHLIIKGDVDYSSY